MDILLEHIRSRFVAETRALDCSWRILRLSALVDLVVYNFYCFETTQFDKHLVEIFNLCMKVKIVFHLGEMNPSANMDEQMDRLKNEEILVLQAYDVILVGFKRRFQQLATEVPQPETLRQKVSYLAVIAQLDLHEYPEECFDDIILSSFRALLASH